MTKEHTATVPHWFKVLRQEARIRLSDKTFLITTLAMVLLLAGCFALAAFLNEDGDIEQRIGVVGNEAADRLTAVSETVNTEGTNLAAVDYPNEEDARDALQNGDVDAVVMQEAGNWRLLVNGSPNAPEADALRQALVAAALDANAADLGVATDKLWEGTEVTVEDASSDSGVSSSVRQMLSLGFGVVFYMAVVLFGTGIAQSVVGEKESRIIEILAAIVPLRQLLLGKILGTSLVAFLQIALFAGVIVVGLQFVDFGIDLSTVSTALLWFIPFFALGFLALACVWAVAGSMAARTEDLQSTSLPLTLGLALVLFAPMLFEGRWLEWASFVPLFSSVLMPVRALGGDLSWWEPLIALALVVLFCALFLWVGERLYRKSVMHTSGTMGWSKLLSK